MTDSMLQISNLYVQFGAKRVLNRFSLRVAQGEQVLVTAPSGAGKSTLLRCILGFLAPDGGTISLNGTVLDSLSTWGLRRQMGYVAQEPALGTGTVRDILERPFTYRANRALRPNMDRVPALLGSLHLAAGILEQELRALSGGEKQRIALIAALLLDRPLLLLDEISASLDKHSAEAVHATLAGLENQTVLAVGHHADALPKADRVVALADDQVQEGH